MAWEWLEKYLTGQRLPLPTPKGEEGRYYDTPGLFGQGSQWGKGGLLTTFNPPADPGGGMLNLFSNLPAVAGMEMIQGGMQGKPIEQTFLPAVKSGLVTTSAVEKVKSSKRKKDYINKYKDQVPKKDMELFLAFPEKYVTAMLSEKMRKTTLGDRATEIFDRIAALPPDEQLAAIKALPQIQQDLYRKYIRQQFNLVEELFTGNLKAEGGEIKTTWKVGDIIEKKGGKKAKVTQVDENGKILAVEEIIK
jgi:hypothetical protein